DDPAACLTELRRVVKPGGVIGMVEFGLPSGVWRRLWDLYCGLVLPTAGRIIGGGWLEVGRFLRRSIEDFHRGNPNLKTTWRAAGLVDVKSRRMSLGGGLVIWGRRP
ncbi:MAG: class I SAM-dependent methyltransferase, partial [Acidimicrobiia bacterium]